MNVTIIASIQSEQRKQTCCEVPVLEKPIKG